MVNKVNVSSIILTLFFKSVFLFNEVTGHGFGHASRSLVTIQALLDRGFHVEVVTSVSPVFFQQAIPSIRVHHRRLDTGAYQANALEVDQQKTLDWYKTDIYTNHDSLVELEVTFLIEHRADLVLSDATPLACIAGKKAGAKVAVLSNFCWDFIFNEMYLSTARSQPEVADMISQVSLDYSAADLLLLYPGGTPLLASFKSIISVPLLSRHATMTPAAVRDKWNIPSNCKILLLGFGGFDTVWKLQDYFLPPGWICLVLSANQNDLPSSRFLAVPSNAYIPDLVGACDCWLGKIGFGTVSEALNHGVPLIYIPRTSWPEEKYLETYLLDKNAGISMSSKDFFDGLWSEYLKEALFLKQSLVSLNSRGEINVVDLLKELLASN